MLVGGDVVPGPFARATLDRLRAARRRAGSAATASARWPRRSTGRSPTPDDLAGVTAKLTRGRARARGLEGARRAPADARARRRPVLPRDARARTTRWSRGSRRPSAGPRCSSSTTAPLVVAGHTHQQDDRVVGDDPLRQRRQRRAALRGRRRGALAVGRRRRAGAAPDRVRPRRAPGERMRERWPDVRSISAALIEPVEPIEVHADLREPDLAREAVEHGRHDGLAAVQAGAVEQGARAREARPAEPARGAVERRLDEAGGSRDSVTSAISSQS